MLFLSQIIPVKGLERLFKVIASIGAERFGNWELIIAGYEDIKHKQFLLKLTTDLKLGGIISFVGPKHGQDKINLFDSSQIFILPSFNENYGIVIAEALARKIPVITTKGAPWEELTLMDCGLWVDNTEDGLKNGLLKLLETPVQRLKEMGARGRELIGSKYLWNLTSLKTIELYQWILTQENKPDFII